LLEETSTQGSIKLENPIPSQRSRDFNAHARLYVLEEMCKNFAIRPQLRAYANDGYKIRNRVNLCACVSQSVFHTSSLRLSAPDLGGSALRWLAGQRIVSKAIFTPPTCFVLRLGQTTPRQWPQTYPSVCFSNA